MANTISPHSPFNTSNSSSPLSPYPRGDTPVSFRTNVNRAKTKRWVEAKKYSYDGDDWGEDEYGEYEYDDELPPVPQTQRVGANQSTPDISSTLPKDTSHPPMPSMDRSRSMDRVQTMPKEDPVSSDSPTTPVIRPADIYKRMREEQQAGQSPPVGLNKDSEVSASEGNPPAESSVSAGPAPAYPEPFHDSKPEDVGRSGIPSASANEVPTISLPDVKRLSGFGSDFSPENDPNPQSNQGSTSQSPQLHHNPSLGFRSAVNQAFDAPETPSTTADSVARSNSDSTTGISPIMARREVSDDRTPTIHEEPNENAATPTEGDIVFRPGHRRDLSVPSPGNSPSRRPVIAGPDASASSELAQVSGGTPAESLDHSRSSQQEIVPHPDTPQPSRETPRYDLPAPLNVQTNVGSDRAAPNEDIPVIVPTLSTENSPADTENDRLRKEIIRSLSRENSPSEHQDTPPQTSGQDNLLPGGYEAYAAPQSTGPPEPTSANVPPMAEAPVIEQPTPIPPQGAEPRLKKRFSWEESSSDEEPMPFPQTQPAQPPLMPGQFPMSQENVSQPSGIVEPTGGGGEVEPENPELTVVPPMAMDTSSIQSSEPAHETPLSQNPDASARTEGDSAVLEHQPLEQPAKLPSGSMESGLLGFKDILGIQTPYGRIQAFDRTRDQFAAIDTGLNNWVQITVQAHPEHADAVARNSKPLSEEFRNSVPRTKFPKLASLGNLASSFQDGPSGSGHIRRPSAPLGSTRQPSGNFLRTAGGLGGQAGKAAKGFFTKGRSKFKGAGSEKVEP